MNNLSSKNKNMLTFCAKREIKKLTYSPHVKRRRIHTQTCAVTLLAENEFPVAY